MLTINQHWLGDARCSQLLIQGGDDSYMWVLFYVLGSTVEENVQELSKGYVTWISSLKISAFGNDTNSNLFMNFIKQILEREGEFIKKQSFM